MTPQSKWVQGLPLLQTYAYAQVFKGGRLHFAFAELPSSLVIFRSQVPNHWVTGHIFTEKLPALSELADYNYALVGADSAYHRHLESENRLQAQTHSGYWRLYRILHQ